MDKKTIADIRKIPENGNDIELIKASEIILKMKIGFDLDDLRHDVEKKLKMIYIRKNDKFFKGGPDW